MGTFSVAIEIGDLRGDNFEEMEALVDTGATTTVIPCSALRRLGIVPTKRETFEYAGSERVELDMAEARARVAGRETTTWVIFGKEGTAPTRWRACSLGWTPTARSSSLCRGC